MMPSANDRAAPERQKILIGLHRLSASSERER